MPEALLDDRLVFPRFGERTSPTSVCIRPLLRWRNIAADEAGFQSGDNFIRHLATPNQPAEMPDARCPRV